jgi:hypothetical protein
MPARGTVNLGEPIHSRLPSLNNLYSSKVNVREPSVKYEWNGGQPEFSNLTQEQRCRMMSYGFGEKERSPSGLIKTIANIGRKHIAKYCSNFGKPAPKPENAQEPSVVYNWDGPAKKKVFSHFFQEAGRMDMLK